MEVLKSCCGSQGDRGQNIAPVLRLTIAPGGTTSTKIKKKKSTSNYWDFYVAIEIL